MTFGTNQPPPKDGTAQKASFGSATAKISIASAEPNITLICEAQYNPKELQFDKSVPWSKVNEANKSNAGSDQGQGIHLEFTGAEGRTMSLELFFDAWEPATTGNTVKISDKIAVLEALASVIKPGSRKEDDRRPHRCLVKYGKTIPAFRCVIESIQTKYLMFDGEGNPLRATCTLKLKEADVVSMAKATK